MPKTSVHSMGFVFSLLISGCGLLESISLSDHPPQANNRMFVRLRQARSIEEINQTLEQLVTDEFAQANAEHLLSNWGREDDWYDLSVMIFLQEYWPSAYGHQTLDAKPLIPIVQNRIREKPELNRQFYWYLQWRWGPFDFPRFCRDVSHYVAASPYVGGEDFIPLMRICGAVHSEDYYRLHVLTTDWDVLGRTLCFAQMEFLTNRPFLRYDDKLGCYRVDWEAKREGRYLKPEDQRATPRLTPLPEWSHAVIPDKMVPLEYVAVAPACEAGSEDPPPSGPPSPASGDYR
ncbi:MAG: hypothetical protein KDA84_12955 [Planctomycetaceae bacterium]|nr:hypothetical protein [Planctomycetaceae bacterium]